ncbi:hypothetical protein [Nocardia caishijiensis]|uniref:Low molecular weight antigen MTB12-like C-terminal domain-containing protein n=1 Tax=Nocardia caishijiensis TaxID=184756 RepID=A0ABQ6YPI7_9NOCA|nr:hypothetical protein [Nocardia caishijiensis]KAF0847704.1 hypothetical protein FNL39_103606 [Nocardia caishijiensis]
MNNRPIKTAAVLVALVASLGLSACASSDTESSNAGATTTAAAFESGTAKQDKEEGGDVAATTPPNLPKPTAEELNARINKALAGQLTGDEKKTYIEDADQDPMLVDKFVDAANKNNVKVTITKVGDPTDGKLKADADVTIDGQPVQDAFIDFVAEDESWKVSHTFACNIVKSAKLDSAACQA